MTDTDTVGEPAATKSKRLNLLIYPELHDALSCLAYARRTSVNNLICKVMGEFAQQHNDEVEKYRQLFGELEAL